MSEWSNDAVSALQVLTGYSEGRIPRYGAIETLGLRDYAELLVALGDASLPMPLPPDDEIERQAQDFVGLFGQAGEGPEP